MKCKNFTSITIIGLILIAGLFSGTLQIYSNNTTQNKLYSTYNTFEEWRKAILDHNNMEPEDFINLPQNSISSLYDQINIYQHWSNGFYSTEKKNQLLLNTMDTPYIKYLGPDNLPIEGYDLKRNDDEKFELIFRMDDNIVNEWILRVYAYLDYGIYDTILSDSEKFEDGSIYKHFQPGEEPSFEELNPDESFMGIEFDKALEDFEQWTTSEKDYTANKNLPGCIDQEIYFHVKVLYKKEINELDGWDSYYYYKNFYISGYWTSNFEHRTLNIKDDDTGAPIISDINIINSPIYDNYSNIKFEIIAEDDSGIENLHINFLGDDYFDDDNDFQISIPNPCMLGQYSFNVIAIDGDTDRDNDQLSTTMYSSFEILDDDDNTPICTDVCIVNAPIYDAYDYVIFEFMAEDPSGISELYINFMENKYYLDENNQIFLPNPRIPGEYEFSAIAIDADTDYQGDQLNTTIHSYFEVFDDDFTPPQIFVCENECGWDVSINDDDGFIDSIASGTYSLFDQDGNILTTGVLSQEGIIYHISKEQIIPLKIGALTLKIHSINNDIEWQGDEETSNATEEVYITLEDCYNCVIEQIEKLKKYVDDNLCCYLACMLNTVLNLAQQHLPEAYKLLLQGQSCWLSHLESAKSLICSIESLIECLIICDFLSYDIGQYIIQSLQEIRNNINVLIEISLDYKSISL